jgi:F-type H+-transporting ATPase subunit b
MAEITAILHDLGIQPRLLVVNVAAFLLILWLLKRFFFGPFGKFLDDRAQRIKEQLSEADQAREQARQDLVAMAERHRQVQEDLARELERQRQTAREEAERIVAEAHRLAQERKRHAEEQLEREAEQAAQELRAHTADLATDIARRALSRALGPVERQASVEAAVRHIEQLAQQERN